MLTHRKHILEYSGYVYFITKPDTHKKPHIYILQVEYQCFTTIFKKTIEKSNNTGFSGVLILKIILGLSTRSFAYYNTIPRNSSFHNKRIKLKRQYKT